MKTISMENRNGFLLPELATILADFFLKDYSGKWYLPNPENEEDLGSADEIEKVISSYSAMYQSLFSEIPSYALKSEYRERLKKSYPFHPELIDMFRLR